MLTIRYTAEAPLGASTQSSLFFIFLYRKDSAFLRHHQIFSRFFFRYWGAKGENQKKIMIKDIIGMGHSNVMKKEYRDYSLLILI